MHSNNIITSVYKSEYTQNKAMMWVEQELNRGKDGMIATALKYMREAFRMGFYIFKYCVNMSQSDINRVANINIEHSLQRATKSNHVFGIVGHGAPVTDHVFIIKADNYKQCMSLIDAHRGMIEGSAWQRGTFGEFNVCTGVQRTDILPNKIHIITQENSKGFTDAILFYKVTEKIKDQIHFFDAMAWAKSCKEAVMGYWDLGVYKESLVYETGENNL